ncbi:MAG TPA: hypothetical protein VFX35_11550 [Solirubrobacterales bacterium]|nr:hypothetical protein [Solirubrobacterales bacterium]
MIKVQLGELAYSGLEEHFRADLPGGVRRALVHYAYKLRVGRRPVPPPRFLPERSSPAHKEFELRLDPESEAILEQEALRQRVGMSQLATHAVLVYLAELEFLGATSPAPTERCRRY